MVYFAYNHIAFVTLLAFVAVNAVKSTDVTEIQRKLHESEFTIRDIILSVIRAEKELQKLKDKILKQNENLQAEIEKYIDCLETAYKYKWGETAFHRIISRLETEHNEKLSTTMKCVEQKVSTYQEKKKQFPVDRCLENPPSVNKEDLDQLNEDINRVFTLKHWIGVHSFYINLYKTLLKVLTRNGEQVPGSILELT
uniref:Uncharacterized protein n=1 Tax=Trichobilharzia regenti TaxID=157069 RepID=A0AA85JNP3_TRIRE|nr:unnamed protein product [Trichobilharzia regenti]